MLSIIIRAYLPLLPAQRLPTTMLCTLEPDAAEMLPEQIPVTASYLVEWQRRMSRQIPYQMRHAPRQAARHTRTFLHPQSSGVANAPCIADRSAEECNALGCSGDCGTHVYLVSYSSRHLDVSYSCLTQSGLEDDSRRNLDTY